MKPAQIVVDIVDAGGFIVAEKGEIVARHVPRHLIPHIREHKAALLALLSESMDDTTAPDPMPYRANLAPQRVSCGSCARFQPGPQPLSIGRCLATVDGQPPKDQRGYLAAYPMAVRSCPEFSGVAL